MIINAEFKTYSNLANRKQLNIKLDQKKRNNPELII